MWKTIRCEPALSNERRISNGPARGLADRTESAAELRAIREATYSGRPFGSKPFVLALEEKLGRKLEPAPAYDRNRNHTGSKIKCRYGHKDERRGTISSVRNPSRQKRNRGNSASGFPLPPRFTARIGAGLTALRFLIPLR